MRWACTNPEVLQPILNHEGALHTPHDLSFESKRVDVNGDIQISAWEMVLNDESQPCREDWVAWAKEKGPGEVHSRLIESRHNEKDVVTAQEMRSSVRELVANEVVTIVEEVLDDVLRKTLHKS